MEFLETSAKTGLNVEKIFHRLSEKLLEKIERGEIDPKNEVIIRKPIPTINYHLIKKELCLCRITLERHIYIIVVTSLFDKKSECPLKKCILSNNQ